MSRISETATYASPVSASEVIVWVLASILTVLFTGLLSVVLRGCLRRDRSKIQVLTIVLQSMKWRVTLVIKSLQSNGPLTHTSMKQSEGEGPSERNKHVCIYVYLTISNIILDELLFVEDKCRHCGVVKTEQISH